MAARAYEGSGVNRTAMPEYLLLAEPAEAQYEGWMYLGISEAESAKEMEEVMRQQVIEGDLPAEVGAILDNAERLMAVPRDEGVTFEPEGSLEESL